MSEHDEWIPTISISNTAPGRHCDNCGVLILTVWYQREGRTLCRRCRPDPLAERLVKQWLICECGELTCPRVEEVVSLLRKYFAERVTEEKIAAKCYLSTHEAERVFVFLQREMGGA